MRAADALWRPSRPRASSTSSASPVGANLPIYDALYDADFTTSRRATSRAPATRPRATRRPRAGSASPSRPRARARPTWSPRSPTRSWTRSRPSSSPGQVRTDLIGTDGFQEADVTGITLPIVKHSFLVTGPAQDPRLHPRGLPHRLDGPARARPGRRPAGPLPGRHRVRADAPAPRTCPATSPRPRATSSRSGWPPRPSPTRGGPVIYAGGGVINANASEELRELGLVGQFPGHLHGDGAGRLPGAARPVARDARHARHPDRQLRDGQRRPDRLRSAPASTTGSPASSPSSRRGPSSSTSTSIPAEISKNVPAHIPIVGDAKERPRRS